MMVHVLTFHPLITFLLSYNMGNGKRLIDYLSLFLSTRNKSRKLSENCVFCHYFPPDITAMLFELSESAENCV